MSPSVLSQEVFDSSAEVLLGSRCGACGALHFPPLAGCPDCFRATVEPVPLSRTGRVRSFTVICMAFPGLPDRYTLAEVELPEGIVVRAQLVGADESTPAILGEVVTVTAGPVRCDGVEELIGYRFVQQGWGP